MNVNELIIYNKEIPSRDGEYVDFPTTLNQGLKDYLDSIGIRQLYSHQAEMFEACKYEKNIVITTSTASGKTLSFLLPVINDILQNPLTRAVFIYPTKALASDQFRALKPYLEYFGEDKISAGVYDGDTPPNERSRIRKSANIILTNPEMLNCSFMPNHSKYGFDFIFANLKYVVIDELHSYRGVFGSHVANLFRRMGRVCRYYGSSPRFLCSSATIANPVELAEEICGVDFIQISRDGSPAAKRKYSLIQPPRIVGDNKEFYGQLQATAIAADMIPSLVENNHSFIAFAKSRRNVEVILREARDKLDSDNFLRSSYADKISGYRGGYTPVERKAIEKKMINGELRGLVSTNALELGIDIGKIDRTIIVGYPGTRASFWQQTGRAGRSGVQCKNYLILESLPFDQYIGINPDWLFEEGSESAIVDKNNLLIELAHIRAAAAEIPLSLDDVAVFPDLGESIPVLLRIGELKNERGKYAWAGNAFPAGDFSLRNMDKNRYKLMNDETHQVITEMDEMQAFREIHEGAIYMHDGSQYQVINLDLQSHTAKAVSFKGNYYTMPGGMTEIKIIKEQSNREFFLCKLFWGDVNVNDIVVMYKKLQFHNHQNLGYEELSKPLSKDYDTESTWLCVPDSVVKLFRGLLQPDSNGQLVRNNHFDGMCHAIKIATRMVTMTEEEDIGVSMSTNAIGMRSNVEGQVFLFIYDKFVGGLGYAEKAFDLMETILDTAIDLLSGCTCEDGCAACVGDYTLNKAVVLWGLKSLREELAPPDGIKLVKYPERAKVTKNFKLGDLTENWQAFCDFLKVQGELYADFLRTCKEQCLDENTLIIFTDNDFYKDWIHEDNNWRALKNIFSFYVECPVGFELKVESLNSNPDNNLKEKLKKRYDNYINQE